MSEVRVIARFVASQGKEDQLKTLLQGMLAPTVAEPGCERYELYESDSSHANIDQVLAECEKALAIVDPLPDSQNTPTIYHSAGGFYMIKGGLSLAKDAGGEGFGAAGFARDPDIVRAHKSHGVGAGCSLCFGHVIPGVANDHRALARCRPGRDLGQGEGSCQGSDEA